MVERGERIVASPQHLAGHLDALGAAHLVEARLRLHQARHELIRIRLRRHGLLLARGSDARVEQLVVDVLVRIGNALERPALRLAGPERLRRIGKGEVANPIAGGRCRDACHRRDGAHELRRFDRNIERHQTAEIMADEMATALAIDRL